MSAAFWANERTILAWNRTELAPIATGMAANQCRRGPIIQHARSTIPLGSWLVVTG